MEKLRFPDHINVKISKANEGIGIIKKLSNIIPKNFLLTIYKSVTNIYDIIYDQPNSESFCTKIVRI